MVRQSAAHNKEERAARQFLLASFAPAIFFAAWGADLDNSLRRSFDRESKNEDLNNGKRPC